MGEGCQAENYQMNERYQPGEWQVIDLPGTIGTKSPLASLSATDLSYEQLSVGKQSVAEPPVEKPPLQNTMTYSDVPQPHPSSPEREAELMSLIRDLNECNDVLLDKVAHLEEALDKSQTALQAEIDRSHGPVMSESRTLSDRHIAQMVTELEVSTQSLKRHQVLNETLQAELTTSQARLTQLDQDCTQMQQKYTDQSQRLLQAEASVQDLQVRLKRQQRYTLQFKAALEKCLNVSSDTQVMESGFVSGTAAASPVTAAMASPGVAMPKVDTIAPWTAQEPSARLDPQLESLIRGRNAPDSGLPVPGSAIPSPAIPGLTTPSPATPSPATPSPATPSPAIPRLASPIADSEAEAQLWRDLARVIEIPDGEIPDGEIPDGKALYEADVDDAADLLDMPVNLPADVPGNAPAPMTAAANRVKQELIKQEFITEEQVWGDRPQLDRSAVKPKAVPAADPYLPAMAFPEATPAPVVYPLRAQKRIASLSAIDLPMFPRLKQPQS